MLELLWSAAGIRQVQPLGGFMDLKYPQWQAPLAAAILEFDVQQFPVKLQNAEDAISKRVQEIAFEKHNQHELQALDDGLSLIRNIKRARCK